MQGLRPTFCRYTEARQRSSAKSGPPVSLFTPLCSSLLPLATFPVRLRHGSSPHVSAYLQHLESPVWAHPKVPQEQATGCLSVFPTAACQALVSENEKSLCIF